jgi:HlyD family secretion protein
MIAARALAIAFATMLAGCSRGSSELALVEVKRGDLVIGVEVLGELAAVDSLDIKPPALYETWDFKIAQLAVEGADVVQGEPIVAFDPSDQVRNLETLENDAEAAKKKLDKKRDDAALARRDEELAIAEAEAKLRKATLKMSTPGDLVASVEQKTLELDEQLAKLHLEQAKNKANQAAKSDAAELQKLADYYEYLAKRVQETKDDIAKMSVVAPRAGTIVFPTNWRGEKKKVGDSAWRMESVLQIVGLGKMVGNGVIDEIDMARVAVAQPVSIKLDALPDVQLRGSVESIAKSVAPKSPADPSNVVKVKITIDAVDGVPLRPGMRFRGEVETERVTNVVQVPAEAVFVTPQGPVAYRSTGDGVARVVVTLGRRNATMIEVVTGLAPGDRVSRVDPDRSGS